MNKWNSIFRQKPTKPLKRSGFTSKRLQVKSKPKRRKMARQRLDTVGKLKKTLWELCKEITRARYRNKDGTFTCYTCGRLIDEAKKAHTGHGIASAVGGALLRFHLDNLRIQDYFCNVNLGGNGAVFHKNLIEEIGQERVDELFRLKAQTVKADRIFYANKINEYTKLLSTLRDSRLLLP